MKKKTFLVAALACIAALAPAQEPEKTVETFGDAMKNWCKTGDIEYRIQLGQVLGGENGTRKCLVDDKIMDWIAANDAQGLTPKSGTREINSYLNGFEEQLVGNATFKMSNCKWDKKFTVPDALGNSKDAPLMFVTADISTSGVLKLVDNDRFFVRGGVITKIMTTSEENSFERALQLYNKHKYPEAFRLFRYIAYNDSNDVDAQYYLATLEILKKGTKGLDKRVRDAECFYWIMRGVEKGNTDMINLYARYLDKKAQCNFRLHFYDMLGDMQLPTGGLVAFRDDDRWGYRDEQGNAKITAEYEKAFPFNSAGLACVKKDGKYFFVDKANQKKGPDFDFLLYYAFNGSYYGERGGNIEVYDHNWRRTHIYKGFRLATAARYPLKDCLLLTNSNGRLKVLERSGRLLPEEMSTDVDVEVMHVRLSDGSTYAFAEWPDLMMP